MVLRVGIISAAWGAFAHLPAWRAVPGIEVTAICTSREETARSAAARFGIERPFWDYRAMAADPDIDIVDCGTRPVLRREMVLAALAAGKHVYNGSPHAPDWAAAREIDAAWRGSGCVGVVDAFVPWLPTHCHMKMLLDQGFVGRPLGGSCRFNLSLFNRPSRQFPYNWFAEAGQGVSAVRNNGSHLLYALLDLFGPVAEVIADDRQLLGEWRFADGGRIVPETNDHADIVLRFASGLTLPMQAGWSMPFADGWAIEVFGAAGRLAATAPSFPTARDYRLAGGQLGKAMAPIAVPADLLETPEIALDWQSDPQPSYPMALSMQRMAAAIAGEATALPDFAMALQVERLQEAIRRSSAERRWVAVAEIV